MLFNSYEFILLFLPLTLTIYYIIRFYSTSNASMLLLILASFFYYAYWKANYLPILIISIILNYSLGMLITNIKTHKKSILILGITLNLLSLAYYKYINFIINNYNSLTEDNIEYHTVLLPLAISFFTFQQIAFLVDTYRKECSDYSFLHYSLFVCFFPQLIAGPIVHHRDVMPQFLNKPKSIFNIEMFSEGIQQFSLGLFKKVLIADNIAIYATPVFLAADTGQEIHIAEAWIATLAYTFQLYFDFSAYSDMAIGIGKMFGIKLPINFNSPYKAKSISDFWRRWHITLSTFLRDYLYITLGGNRSGKFKKLSNLLLTMLLGGLWHGANWNFVIWGGIHGISLIIHQTWNDIISRYGFDNKSSMYGFLSQLITFFIVIEAWVIFRAETYQGAISIYTATFRFSQLNMGHWELNNIDSLFKATSMLLICATIVFLMPNINTLVKEKNSYVYNIFNKTNTSHVKILLTAFISGTLILSISSLNRISEFLYFQF